MHVIASNGDMIASFLASKRRKTTPKAQSLKSSEFSLEKIVNINAMKTEVRKIEIWKLFRVLLKICLQICNKNESLGINGLFRRKTHRNILLLSILRVGGSRI